MIRGVGGVPGAGKTYFLIEKVLAKELQGSARWVVTNLTEINLPELQETLVSKYGDKAAELSQRLQIIPKDQSRHWIRYRGAYTLPPVPEKAKTEPPEDFDRRLQEYFAEVNGRKDVGVCYILDEAHRWSAAAEWSTYAGAAIFYLSQHRHLNDTFWWASQHPEQVIPYLRRASQDYHYLRNHYVESWSIFRKPGGFRYESYNFVPESKSRGVEPNDRGTLYLDVKGWGKCYKTRGALGGEIAVAEEKPQTRKLPFWTLFLFIGLGAAGVVALLAAIPSLAGKVLGSAMRTTTKAMTQAVGLKQPEVSSPAGDASPKAQAPKTDAKNETAKKVAPRVVSYLTRGETLRVHLDDGRTLTEQDRVVRAIDARGVITFTGEIWPMVPLAPPKPASRGDGIPRETRSAVSEGTALAASEREGAQNAAVSPSTAPSESPPPVQNSATPSLPQRIVGSSPARPRVTSTPPTRLAPR